MSKEGVHWQIWLPSSSNAVSGGIVIDQCEGDYCPHGSALMTAAVADNIELATLLLQAGADPNGSIDSSGTPAIRATSDAMRGLLYSYGGLGRSAWSYIQNGDIESLGAILRYCEDPFAQEEEEYLTTPYPAIISGYARQLRKGGDTSVFESMLALFLTRKYPMSKVLTACRSYLHAVPSMRRQLLENGLDPNLPDWQRRTPLHVLADRPEPDAQPAGARCRCTCGGGGLGYTTGLAQRRGHGAIAELLRKRGAEAPS